MLVQIRPVSEVKNSILFSFYVHLRQNAICSFVFLIFRRKAPRGLRRVASQDSALVRMMWSVHSKTRPKARPRHLERTR